MNISVICALKSELPVHFKPHLGWSALIQFKFIANENEEKVIALKNECKC